MSASADEVPEAAEKTAPALNPAGPPAPTPFVKVKVDGVEIKRGDGVLRLGPLAPSAIADAWTKLGATKNACSARDLHFDYWPEGGVRNVYCHAISVMTWKALVKLSGVKPFARGGDTLKLHQAKDFGRYNPAFVRWLVDNAIPAATDRALREKTQVLYEQYLRQLARTYYVVHEKLAAKPEWRKRERELYLKTMDEKNPDWSHYYDKHSDFLGDSAHDWGGYDPNLQSASVAFWLRRDVDDTAPLFLEALTKLLRTYDAAWLDGRKR